MVIKIQDIGAQENPHEMKENENDRFLEVFRVLWLLIQN